MTSETMFEAPRKIETGTIRWFLLSLVLALAIQILGISFLNPIGEYDATEYLKIAESIFKGKGFEISGVSFEDFETFEGESPTRMRQPLYPLYLAATYWLPGASTISTQVSQVLLNALTLFLILLIGIEVFGRRFWSGTLVVVALYFPLWLTSAFILAESLLIFLLTLSMFLLLKAIRSENRLRRFAFAGAVFGLAFLTKPIALTLPVLSLIPIWVHFGLKRALLRWIILMLSFAAVVSPWFVRNAVVLGDYTALSTDGGYNLWCAASNSESEWFNNPEFREAVQKGYYLDRHADRTFTDLAIEHIKSDPLGYFGRGLVRSLWAWSYFPGSRNYKDNAVIFGLFTLVQIMILITAIVGLTTLDKRRAVFLLLPAVALTCVLIVTKGISRFIVPSMPFVLLLSGHGLHDLLCRIRRLISLHR